MKPGSHLWIRSFGGHQRSTGCISKRKVGYDMIRTRICMFSAMTIIWAVIFLPSRAKAVQRASDATNLHQNRHATAKGGVTILGEERAEQVLSHLLPDIPGKQVVILSITYPPGYSGSVHRHYAYAFAYVMEGSVTMGVKDSAPLTLGPGQTFFEGPNDIHTISRNASKTKPAKFLVFLIKNKDAPITVPAK